MTSHSDKQQTDGIPAISVVMSVYNGARFLREAIDSILAQSFTDFEFIIIDDGSIDETPSILATYRQADARIVVIHQQNQGLTKALNLGCRIAKADLIARMDADDIALPDRFERQFRFLKANPHIGLIGGAFDLIDIRGRKLYTALRPLNDQAIREALLEGSAFLHPSILMRKEVFSSAGGYREITYAEDYDLWLRMSELTRVANLPDVLLKYRVHAEQISVSKCIEQALGASACQISAKRRRKGQADPFNGPFQISSDSITNLGVSDTLQQTNLARGYLSCVRHMYLTREFTSALIVLDQLMSIHLRTGKRWIIADTYLFAAKIHWRLQNINKAAGNLFRALLVRPVIVGRPIKILFRNRYI